MRFVWSNSPFDRYKKKEAWAVMPRLSEQVVGVPK